MIFSMSQMNPLCVIIVMRLCKRSAVRVPQYNPGVKVEASEVESRIGGETKGDRCDPLKKMIHR